MNRERRGSVMLPILLILLGVGLLLDQLSLWQPDWEAMLRFWPALLVLLGLEIIARGNRAASLAVGVLTVAVVVVVALLAWPSVAGGPRLEAREFVVPLQDMDEASVRLEVGVATLDLAAGTGDSPLLRADVTYRPSRTQLAMDTSTRLGRGTVLLRGDTRSAVFGSGTSDERWDVRLRPQFPLALAVKAGVGSVNLDLRGISLTHLDLQGGVGTTRMTLSERGSYEAVVNAGVGSIDIVIPTGVAARIRIDTGLGEIDVDPRFAQEGRYYVTAGYDTAANRVDVDIDAGIGRITVR